MSQVIKIKGFRAKSVHLGLKFDKFDRTHGAARAYCGSGEVSTGSRMPTQYGEMPEDTEVTCKKCLKLDAETKQAEADKTAAARAEFQEKLAAERAAAVEVVETVEVAPVATEAGIEVAPLVAAITPAMADMLSSHSGGSESLDAAQDAGVTWTDGVLTVPASGWYQLNWFLGMRAELAMENGVDCPSIVLSKFVSEAR